MNNSIPIHREIKFRAVIHLKGLDILLPSVDIYGNGMIGCTGEYFRKFLPKNYFIHWEDDCIKHGDPVVFPETTIFIEDVNVLSILTGDDYIWIEGDKNFTLQQYVNKKDKYGVEIFDGDTCAFEVEKQFKKVLIRHFQVRWERQESPYEYEGWTQFSPLDKIVVCNKESHLVDSNI